jgi:hypothetical protein
VSSESFPAVSVMRDGDTAVVRIVGPVRLRDGLLSAEGLVRELEAAPAPVLVRVDASALGPWDTGLVALLARLFDACSSHNVALDTGGWTTRRTVASASSSRPGRGRGCG